MAETEPRGSAAMISRLSPRKNRRRRPCRVVSVVCGVGRRAGVLAEGMACSVPWVRARARRVPRRNSYDAFAEREWLPNRAAAIV